MSRVCKECGAPIADGIKFCQSCGTPVEEPQPQPQPQAAYGVPPQPQPQPVPVYAAQPGAMQQAVSTFDGGVLDTFVTFLAASLLITFTLGIATPWAICYVWKFIIAHVIIDGRRLTFDGNGGQLFGNWIKWLLLTLITCGIYSFWVYPRLFEWVAKHTHFAF